MSTIVTRTGKGSALTHTELDANFTNLNTDKLENINSESVGDLSDVDITTSPPTTGQALVWNGTEFAPSTVASTTEVSDDTTPQLGGNLDVNGNSITSNTNGNVAIAPNGTGKVVLSGIEYPAVLGSDGQVLTTNGAGVANWADAAGGGGELKTVWRYGRLPSSITTAYAVVERQNDEEFRSGTDLIDNNFDSFTFNETGQMLVEFILAPKFVHSNSLFFNVYVGNGSIYNILGRVMSTFGQIENTPKIITVTSTSTVYRLYAKADTGTCTPNLSSGNYLCKITKLKD